MYAKFLFEGNFVKILTNFVKYDIFLLSNFQMEVEKLWIT